MKLNKLASFGLASALFFAGVRYSLINSYVAVAKPSQNTRLVTQSVVASGSFVTTEQEHPTTGTVKIINTGGKRYLEFGKDFDTARGPLVRVVLHRNGSVPVNLQEKDYVTLAPLKSFTDAQRYAIPESINLDDFKSVAIWCEQFNVTFGFARLESA